MGITLPGKISADLTPTAKVRVGTTVSNMREVDFVLDTGFSRHVSVTHGQCAEFAIPLGPTIPCDFAGGKGYCHVCDVLIQLPGAEPKPVEAHVFAPNVLGTALISGSRVSLEFVADTDFEVTPV